MIKENAELFTVQCGDRGGAPQSLLRDPDLPDPCLYLKKITGQPRKTVRLFFMKIELLLFFVFIYVYEKMKDLAFLQPPFGMDFTGIVFSVDYDYNM